MEYIDLHIHTEYTKGNCITKIPDLVRRAKDYKMQALAITDSGTVDGFSEFIRECNNFDIKPILGCGFYFASMGLKLKETEHLVLLAKNRIGYDNLLKLVEFSKNSCLSDKPRIDFEILKRHSDNLICLTGGIGGVFDKPFIAGNRNMAIDNLKELKHIFKTDLYIEIQDNELEINTQILDEILKVSRKLDIEMLITGGSFYLDRANAEACNKLREKNGNRLLEGSGYFFKPPMSIISRFKDLDNPIKNSNIINNSITIYLTDNDKCDIGRV